MHMLTMRELVLTYLRGREGKARDLTDEKSESGLGLRRPRLGDMWVFTEYAIPRRKFIYIFINLVD